MEFKHISVLLRESVDALRLRDGGIYVDGTLGGGGHSYEILSRNDTVRLIGIDRDTEAIQAANKRLEKFEGRFETVNDNFSNVSAILSNLEIPYIDGAILDLGVSSYQLDNAERGFSYMNDAPLDMRMNRNDKLTAYDVVNEYEQKRLEKIFYDYGEEKWSKRIAEFIADRRKNKAIETTFELVDVIKAAVPAGAREGGGHPAKRIFQAIRIEVNGELKILDNALRDFVRSLRTGGRMAVITFHSLEDRIVKRAFADMAEGCICPKSFPVCVCGRVPEVKLISRKPILPSGSELDFNSRAKSAKLRVIEKL